jgi:hypothetical protein
MPMPGGGDDAGDDACRAEPGEEFRDEALQPAGGLVDAAGEGRTDLDRVRAGGLLDLVEALRRLASERAVVVGDPHLRLP